MIKWRNISAEEGVANWEKWQNKLNDACLYQSFKWGEYKAAMGQPQLRIAGALESEPVVLIQGTLRRLPLGIGFLWVPGGPVGDLEHLTSEGLASLRQHLGLRYLVVRCSFMRERDAKSVARLVANKLARAWCTVNSGLSMQLKIPPVGSEPLSGASSNWRHNLKRGLKRVEVQPLTPPSPAEIAETYQRLQETKGIAEQFPKTSFDALIKEFGIQLRAFGVRNPEGRLIAMRACLIAGSTGWDIWAASTEEARKIYASHALLDRLLHDCQSHGLTSYDLSGIDPAGNVGVYNFKKGTGSSHIEYLGEWDWSTNSKLTFVFNFLLWLKK